MKIGFVGDNFITWGGGIDFLKLYINSIYDGENDIFLFIPYKDSSIEGLKRLFINQIYMTYHRIVKHVKLSGFSVEDILLNFKMEFPDINYVLYDAGKINEISKIYKIDVLFPCNRVIKHSVIPWIGYIYDFQHKYHPEYFSSRDIKLRNDNFHKMLNNSPAVVCNSYDVKKDCDKFYPDHEARIYVTPFSPIPRSEWLEDRPELLKKYNIDYPYIIICNQFWVHKGHLTAIKAFGELVKRTDYSDYHLICTGSLQDSRSFEYVNVVKSLISSLGLEDKIHLLGYIDKADQIELLKNSRLVLQPTTFEGGPGGGAAYDAISLGKPILLSDIAINKEVIGDRVYYFSSGDESSLLGMLMKVLEYKDEKVTLTYLHEQSKKYKDNLKKYILDMLHFEIENQEV